MKEEPINKEKMIELYRKYRGGDVKERISDISRDRLQDLYSRQKRSMYRIAKQFGCCHHTVRKYLIKHNIPIRPWLRPTGKYNPQIGEFGIVSS